MWQGLGDTSMPTFVDALAFMRERVGVDRLLFGSDRTGTPLRTPISDWVAMFRRLPETAQRHGYSFSQQEVAMILGDNAQRLFRLGAPERG